jgi:hypothetical protein
LILAVVTVALAGVVAVALVGLNRSVSHGVEHAHSLQVSQGLADLHGAVDDVQAATREETTAGAALVRVEELNGQLRAELVPAVGAAITAIAVLDKEDRQFPDRLTVLTTDTSK